MPRPLVLLIYNFLFPLALLAMAPRALQKMRQRGGRWRDLWQRLGFFSAEQREAFAALRRRGPLVWMHAVSVGEVGIGRKLILEILRARPQVSFVLSTTTPTGFALAAEFARTMPLQIVAVYNPLDGFFTVRRCLAAIAPAKLVLVEAEVWPNLVAAAARRGIPVELVNARLSPRSERRYRRFRALTAPVFSLLARVQVQEPEDVARWTALGVGEDRIVHTGSVKFDPQGQAADPGTISRLRSVLHSRQGAGPHRVVLAASTHDGEEAAVGGSFARLRAEMPDLFLIVVPRHVERAAKVEKDLRAAGLAVRRRTEELEADSAPDACDVLLVDTTGELAAWQNLADVVVIGKSFLATGGQNPAEALTAGKPVVFGPHMENFDALVKMVLAKGGAVQVPDLSALDAELAALLRDPARAGRLAAAGRDALRAHDGATRRAAGLVLEKL
jgi:3-deoxy-D-manno-octulosonic-acid transferase